MAANSSKRNSSSDALKKLEDQLTCTICFKLFSEPKILQCFHVFCMECIELLLAKQSEQEECALSCPICRQLTPISARGAAGLQSAFHMYHLFDIHEDLMEVERERSASHGSRREYVASHNGHRGRSASYTAKRGSLVPPQVSCPEHKLRKVEVLCETCDKLICTECSYNQEHRDHERKILNEAAKERKKELINSIKPVEDYCTVLTGAIKEVAKTSDEIKVRQNEVESEIDSNFGLIIDYVKARKVALVDELKHISERKCNVLADQKDEMEVLLEKVNNCIQFIHGSVQIPNEEEIFQLKKEAMKKIGDLTNQFLPQSSLVPSEEAKTKFSGRLDEIEDSIKKFGEAYSFDVCPENCNCAGLGLESGTVGEKSWFIIQAVNSKMNICEELVHSVECEVVSEITDSKIVCNVHRKEEGLHSLYEISYIPLIKGRHQLHVQVEGKYVKESPFTVAVKSPSQESMKSPVLTIENLKQPSAVALTPSGKIIIAEENKQLVSMFRLSGDECDTLKIEPSRSGQLPAPRGVAVDNDGNIFILDSGTFHVLKYSPDKQFVASLDVQDEQLNFPIGLAFNPKTLNLYLADSNKHCIHIIGSDLTISGQFGEKGSGKGQLWYPSSIACDNIGNIYVADSGNHRIQVFSPNGKFLKKFGKEGSGKGQLKCPSGVSVSDNYVYVSEQDNHRISVFTCNGRFIHSFGDDGVLSKPQGLTVDRSGVVYICDYGNNCLQLF